LLLTILWSQVKIISRFESLMASSILGMSWNDSSCIPNKSSNVFCLAIHVFQYKTSCSQFLSALPWIVAILILISLLTIVNITLAMRSELIWWWCCKIRGFQHVCDPFNFDIFHELDLWWYPVLKYHLHLGS